MRIYKLTGSGKGRCGSKSLLFVLAIFLLLTVMFPVASLAAVESIKITKVDANSYPEVKVYVSFQTPPEIKLSAANFEVKENGKKVSFFSVSESASIQKPVAIILALDCSGSMKGNPFAEAKKAMNIILSRKRNIDVVGLIAFNERVFVNTGLLVDAAQLRTKLQALDVGGNTAIFDAVAEGAKQLANAKAKDRYLIVLTDGEDNSSKTGAAAAIDICRKNGVSVYSIGLGEKPQVFVKITEIAGATGGKYYQAPDEKLLSDIYSEIAKTIYSEYLITYASIAKKADQIEISVSASFNGKKLESKPYQAVVPFAGEVAESDEKTPQNKSPLIPILIGIVGAISATGIFYAVFDLVLSPPDERIKKLKAYERAWRSQKEPNGIRDRGREGLLSLVNRLITIRGMKDFLQEKIEEAGVNLKASEFFAIHILLLLFMGSVSFALGGALAMLIAILVLAYAPFIYLEIKKAKRHALIETQLPEALTMISHSLRAGYGLMQAIDLASSELSPPLSTEFKRVVKEMRLGLSSEEALNNMAARVRNESFSWTVTAINIQREVGGNLSEILDKIAETLRERLSFKDYVKALSAEGRLSAYILMALPVFEFLVLLFIAPSYISVLVTTNIGIILLFVALVLMLAGWLWMKEITNVEY